jgi:hypothetical protein
MCRIQDLASAKSYNKQATEAAMPTHLDLVLALGRLAVLVLLLCRHVELAVLDDL